MLAASWPFIPTTLRPSAVRQLHDAGFPLGDLSIVGRDFQETEEPYGFVSRGDYTEAGAETGAWFGGMFGLFIGAGFLILPGLGLVVVAGPIAAALLAGIEGAVAGTALGSLAGAFIGWGVPKDRAINYETQVRGQVSRRSPVHAGSRRPRRSLLAPTGPEHIEVHEPPMS